MVRRYREAVEVQVQRGAAGRAAPAGFSWRGGRYEVLAVLGHWREDAGYWVGASMAVPQRDLWRVEAAAAGTAPGVYELVCEAGGWRLDRVWD